jgi:hypothetical protein
LQKVYGVAGVANDDVTKFNVANIVIEAIRGKQGFPAKMDAATEAITPRLRREVASPRSDRPSDFADIIDSNKGGLAVVLIGIQDGVPYGIAQSFAVSVNSKLDVSVVPQKREQCPGIVCPAGV